MTDSATTAPVAGAAGIAWRRLPVSGRIGFLLLVGWIALALLAPVIAPYSPNAFVAKDSFEPISAAHWLGTDYLGRDVLSRLLYGTRYTVGLAMAAAILACGFGATIALTAVTAGGWTDEIVSRFMDTLISIPSKIFALVLIAAFGSSLALLLLFVAITYLPGAYRISRSLALNIDKMDFVQAARARGEGRAYIARAEILPNMIHPVLTDFGLRFVFAVLLLSGLSFLGLGVQPPGADLGSLVRENISGIGIGASAILFPALAIGSLTVGVNLLIDSLRASGRGAGGGS